MKRIAVLAICAFGFMAACRDKDDVPKAATPAAAETKKDADDDDGPGVTMSKEAQARAGIKVEALTAHPLQPELIAYGHLEEDPSSSFTVRAEFAGVLNSVSGHAWPSVGQTLPDHDAFGRIEPRLTVTDRIGLNTQLATARADLNAAKTAITADQIAYDRARALNADNKNVSDRVVQEAAAKLAADQARLSGAQTLIDVIEGSAKTISQPIVAERGGEVVEVTAHPGESIEQGSPVVRLARFDQLLARIDIPPGEQIPAGPARVIPTGFENQHPLRADRIAAQGVTLLYKLSGTLPGLRPGVAVTARFTLPGTAGEGVTLPPSAIVQQDGRSWAYVLTKENRFSRRPAASTFAPGDRVVITGAQTLLSEEFKSKNEPDTN